jgi:flagellar basal body-associated protein FliL
MAVERTTNEARQGETSRGNRVLTILVVSTGLAIVLAAIASWWLFATPAEEAAAPIPELSSPATPPAGNPPGQ